MNYREMIMSVVRVLYTHLDAISTMAIFMTVYNRLGEILNEIQIASTLQSSTNNRYHTTKDELKEETCEVADIINDIIEVKAHVEGAQQLALEMSDSKSDLLALPDNMLTDKLSRIGGYVTENLTDLETNYCLEASLVERFTTLKQQWENIVSEMQDRKVTSSDSTKKIDLLVEEAMDLIRDRLDGMMKLFKHKDPAFYRQYVSARVLVDEKAHRESSEQEEEREETKDK